jgi:hypothetical protein
MSSTIPVFSRIVKRPHRVYNKEEIEPILDYLTQEKIPWGAIAKIAYDSGIPHQTLSDWRKVRTTQGSENWFPLLEGHPNMRVFSQTQEQGLKDYITTNMINSGYGPERSDIQRVASNAYSAQSIGEFRRDRFCASSTFTSSFMKRWNLSLRTPHAERRAHIDEDQVEMFTSRLNSASSDYPLNRILNFDETCWKIYMGPKKVIAEKGTDTVKLQATTGEKLSLTAFGVISAAGEKLPLWVIAKGKTERSLRKFGEIPGVVFKFSESGWATEQLILEFIEWLSVQVNEEPCMVIMDVYPTHRTERVKEKAFEKNIEILYVPAGGTSKYQPLDARVFGELKSRARAEFHRLEASEGVRGASFSKSVKVLLDCWEKISSSNIEQAWAVVGLKITE